MVGQLRGRHPVGLIAIGVVLTLVLSGTAMAVTDTSFTYSTVQTGNLMIGPGDLVPDDDANDYSISHVAATSAAGACFLAPVHLPQGARMTRVRTSYFSGAGSDISLGIDRFNPVTFTSGALISRTVLDDSSTVTFVNDAVPANLALVSNALYTYTYRVCVGNSDAFYGARITYTYTSAGD